MADLTDIQLAANAERAAAVGDRLAGVAKDALEASLTKGEVNPLRAQVFASMRIKLFLKYVMGDYESVLTGIHSNEKMEAGSNGG